MTHTERWKRCTLGKLRDGVPERVAGLACRLQIDGYDDIVPISDDKLSQGATGAGALVAKLISLFRVGKALNGDD